MGDYLNRVANLGRLQDINNIGDLQGPRIRHVIYVDPDRPLRFYACGSFQIVAGDLVDISQASLSKIVAKVSSAIARKRAQIIRFPSCHAATTMQQKFMDTACFSHVVGCVDSVHIQIQAPPVENKEIYRCRKAFMSLNVQGISDADLRFLNIVARWPGSTHDARIFDNSLICNRFENNEIPGLLLGDKGYPCRPFLMTPFRNPNNPAENRYNTAHKRTRSVVERLFGVWKKRFPCLKFGIRCKLETAMKVIVATAVLHNIARDLGEPEISDEEDEPEEDEHDNALYMNDNDVLGNAMRQTIVEQYFRY
ncbi:putative nuclease HARBI1 [Lineus longissimus]|uniref:putative nuclease HARBI1 n=1 Tax=Lineus longissimus TaxID=88925 RepID=UPI00315DF125